MKRMLMAVIVGCSLPVLVLAQQAQATYVDAAKVAGGGTFATAPAYTVQLLKRTAAGQAEVHTKETDIFYVVEGDATFVTGGRVIGGKETQPNQIRGEAIDGGETFHLKKGDVVTVPAGVPHWFKAIGQPVSYFTVKSITP